MARTIVLDEWGQTTVVALVSAGMSQRQAADHVGCDASTITKLAGRDETFARQLKAARLQSQRDPLELVKLHASKSWRAAAWLLEKCHPHLYGKTAQVNQRALEEQRLQMIQIVEDEVGDRELIERIIDRMQELELQEAEKPEPRDDTPPKTNRPQTSPPQAKPKAAATKPTAIREIAAAAKSGCEPMIVPSLARHKCVLIGNEEMRQLYPVRFPHALPTVRAHDVCIQHVGRQIAMRMHRNALADAEKKRASEAKAKGKLQKAK